MSSFFVLAGKGPARRIANEYVTEEDASRAVAMNPETFCVVARNALNRLPGPDLVAVHNSIVQKEKAVARFATKSAAVRRVLAAWDARLPAPTAPPPSKNNKVTAPVTARHTGVKINLLAYNGAKRWQKGSARSQAYEWLREHPELKLEEAIPGLEKHLSLNRTQVRGLLAKLRGVKLLKVTSS